MKYISVKNEKGFSLIELLVAITVLAIALLGIAGLQGNSIKRNVSAMQNTEAIALIEDKIEEYRNTPFGNISDDPTTETGLGSGGIFTRKCTIQDGVPIPGYTKTLSVKVSWDDPGGRSFSFQTVLSN